jgi:uncharacterized cupin superfamily protein
VGGERWGGTLYELAPGEQLPYHWHYGEEEVCVVAAGTPTLRAPGGDRVLRAWDVAWFVRGETGAHQLRNDSDEVVRLVVFSTVSEPEVVVYPETGDVGVFAPRNVRLR